MDMFNAEKYAINALQQRAIGYKMFAENHSLIVGIPVGGRVLDIGCGPGTVTQILSYCTNLGEIVGTDVDPKMIDEAKKRNTTSRFSFHVWDIQQPLQHCGKFDLVTANAMMHWINDQHAALKNIYDCLKPGGHFLAHFSARKSEQNTVDYEKWQPFIEEAKYNVRKNRNRPWETAENPADFYRKMVEDNHKFKVIVCEFRTEKNFYNEAEVEAHCEMQAANALKKDVSEEKRVEFIKDRLQRVRTTWDCISTETGKYYVHKNERIVLLAQRPKE